MRLVPRLAKVALVGLAMAGLTAPVFAGGMMPGNGGSIALPTVLPPSVQESLLPFNSSAVSSGFDVLGQKFGVQNGRLDIFSVRPSEGGDFKPLLRGGVGEGGLKLQLKW
jgi:hypothetical protein